MKFKVGDKVHFDSFSQKGVGTIVAVTNGRVLPYLVHSLDIKDGHNAQNGYVQDNLNNYWFQEHHLELVTNDYITTKDFIKEVEKLGYEAYIQNDYIKVLFNTDLVHINKNLVNKFSTAFATLSDEELDLIVKYTKTPIEFREVKEYTLQCPLTGAYLYVESTNSGKPVWLHKNNFKTSKEGIPKYTQQEIDNLPNQEFIKTLIKKEVEYD